MKCIYHDVELVKDDKLTEDGFYEYWCPILRDTYSSIRADMLDVTDKEKTYSKKDPMPKVVKKKRKTLNSD